MFRHMQRTTLRLDEELLRQIKRLATAQGRTMTAVVHEALQRLVAASETPPAEPPPELPTEGRGGLRPGVDLSDARSLLDLMEGGG